MATQIDYTRVTPNIDIQAARNGIEIDVSKRGLRGPRGEQGPGVGETVASITSGRGFWPLRKALATGTARVVAMGDSKTEGAGVDTVDQRWLNQLMGTLRARYAPDGDQGLGYLPAYYATFYGFPSAPTTSGSAATVGNGGGLGNRSRHLQAGGSVTWTVPAWTSGVPLLVHWTQRPGLGDLEVVTGDTVRGTITTGGAAVESKVTAVTIPAGTTSITVRHKSGTGTGNAARVEGIVHRTATTGVTIYDGARSGAKLVDYAQGLVNDGAHLSDDWHFQAVAAVQPHAVILAFGANDQASRTPAQWGADLRTVVDKAKAAAPGAGIIVLHGAQRTEDVTADPMRVLRFEAAAREAVGADPDVTILYESTLWKPTAGVDYTSGDPSGWLADTVHTGPEANAQIARYLAAQVTSADAATDAAEVASEAIKPAVTAAQAAQTSATQAAADADTAATRAENAEAAKLEIPDANTAAMIGNPTTETRQALDAAFTPDQVDIVRLVTDNAPRYTQMLLAKVGTSRWQIRVDDGATGVVYQMVKDTNDDFIKIDACYTGYGQSPTGFDSPEPDDLTGTWNTATSSYYTQQVGAQWTMTVPGHATDIALNVLRSNRGGLWSVSVDGADAVVISCYSADSTSLFLAPVADGLTPQSAPRTVVGTFLGDDPENPPATSPSRGFIRKDDTEGTLRGYVMGASPSVMVLADGSNKEMAITLGQGTDFNWMPDHGTGTAFNLSDPVWLVDGAPYDLESLDVGSAIPARHVELRQHFKGIIAATSTDVVEVNTSTRFGLDGVLTFSGRLTATDTVWLTGYPLMLPAFSTFTDTHVTGILNAHVNTAGEDYTFMRPERDAVYSGGVISSTNPDIIGAATLTNPRLSMRRGSAVGKPPRDEALFVWNRATKPKMYWQPLQGAELSPGDAYSWGFDLVVSQIPGIRSLLLKSA